MNNGVLSKRVINRVQNVYVRVDDNVRDIVWRCVDSRVYLRVCQRVMLRVWGDVLFREINLDKKLGLKMRDLAGLRADRRLKSCVDNGVRIRVWSHTGERVWLRVHRRVKSRVRNAVLREVNR